MFMASSEKTRPIAGRWLSSIETKAAGSSLVAIGTRRGDVFFGSFSVPY